MEFKTCQFKTCQPLLNRPKPANRGPSRTNRRQEIGAAWRRCEPCSSRTKVSCAEPPPVDRSMALSPASPSQRRHLSLGYGRRDFRLVVPADRRATWGDDPSPAWRLVHLGFGRGVPASCWPHRQAGPGVARGAPNGNFGHGQPAIDHAVKVLLPAVLAGAGVFSGDGA
jgi:hypothetical protein